MSKSFTHTSSPCPSISPSRRGFLRSSSAVVALPFLESLRPGSKASAAVKMATVPPKRMVFLGMGFGVTADRWYPDVNTVGAEYKMPNILRPLEKH